MRARCQTALRSRAGCRSPSAARSFKAAHPTAAGELVGGYETSLVASVKRCATVVGVVEDVAQRAAASSKAAARAGERTARVGEARRNRIVRIHDAPSHYAEPGLQGLNPVAASVDRHVGVDVRRARRDPLDVMRRPRDRIRPKPRVRLRPRQTASSSSSARPPWEPRARVAIHPRRA